MGGDASGCPSIEMGHPFSNNLSSLIKTSRRYYYRQAEKGFFSTQELGKGPFPRTKGPFSETDTPSPRLTFVTRLVQP
jgi:hypothetical protein